MDRLVWDKLLCTRRQRPSLAEKKDSKPNKIGRASCRERV